MTGALPRHSHLQIVRPPAPPRPRRIHVTISAVLGREPVGRTRPIRLTERDLAWLVEAAEKLERLA